MNGRQGNPHFWEHFNSEKTPRKSDSRGLLLGTFVSLSAPAHCTPRDIVEQILMQSQDRILIESLSDDLNGPVYPRGRAVFGFLGSCLDKIAGGYPNMQWWVSEKGLNMAVVTPEAAQISNFNKLTGELCVSKEKNGKLSADAVLAIAKAIDESKFTLDKELQPAQWKPIAEYNRKYSKRAIKTFEQATTNTKFVRCVRRRLYAARDKYRKAFPAA
jgi:hypothetical protein